MIDYSKFKKALKHLQDQFENHQNLDPTLPDLIKEAVSESVIQRFETCWDSLWKVLRRYLKEEIGLPEVPNGPKPVLRLANENRLLPDSIERWIEYANARISTSHDYSGEKAQTSLSHMEGFIQDATHLYERLSEEQWQ